MVVGSVSGGCIERQLFETRREPGTVSGSTLTIGDDAARAVGLTCGGTLELIFDSVDDPETIEAVLVALHERRRIVRTTDVATGLSLVRDATNEDAFTWDSKQMSCVFGPSWRVLLIGAGQLSRQVAQFAIALDFDVVVCEPRAPFREAFNIDGALLVDELPDDAVTNHTTDARSAVLALAHEPSLDDLALEEALGAECFYIGALGSRRSHEKRAERLRSIGISASDIPRISAPVGIDIGSRTSAEIAVSIVAELVATRARTRARIQAGVQLEHA